MSTRRTRAFALPRRYAYTAPDSHPHSIGSGARPVPSGTRRPHPHVNAA